MNPIPLTAPNGVLYGYACGVCHLVPVTFETFNDSGKPVPAQVEDLRQQAEECCVCNVCETALPADGVCSTCPPDEPRGDIGGLLDQMEADAADERRTILGYRAAVKLCAELDPYADGPASFASWREVFDAITAWRDELRRALK